MKALTVQQPWAWAIIHGGKDVENRTQAWSYRGPLAIHAGARWSGRGARAGVVWDALLQERGIPTGPASALDQWPRLFPFGAIIGVVDLVDVHEAQRGRIFWGTAPGRPACCESSWAELEYAEHGGRLRREIVHLVLRDPRPLDRPIPCRGNLGLWTPPPDTLDELRAVA